MSSEIEDTKTFETAVQPALVKLLMAVLNRCGMDGLETQIEEELEEKMESMLKQARKVISLLAFDERTIDDDESAIADRVSRFVVSRLTMAMDELNQFQSNNDKATSGASGESCILEAGDENDETMATLLSERDSLRTNAARACTLLQLSMESMISSETNGISEHSNGTANGHARPSSSPSTNSLELQDVTLHIVDKETKQRFENEKSRLETLKSKVRQDGESSETVTNLRESVSELETKRRGYRERIAQLRAELEDLQAKEQETSSEIESLFTQLETRQQQDEIDARQLDEDIARARVSVKHGNLVSGLAGMMKTYGRSVEKATASKTGKALPKESSSTPEVETSKPAIGEQPATRKSTTQAMNDYLVKVQNYFLTEARCAKQLRHRLATKKLEVQALRSELDQYNSAKGLFGNSTTIVSTIRDNITQMERIVRADTHRLAAITNDGTAMYESLLEQLETYRFNTAEIPGNGFETTDATLRFPTDLLEGVPAAIRALAIDCDDGKLASFAKEPPPPLENNDEEEDNGKPAAGDDLAANAPNPAEDGSEVPAVAAPAAAAPYVAPKLVWASAGAQRAATTKKQSLLDIQQEELIRSRD